jgi:hypothetical protein
MEQTQVEALPCAQPAAPDALAAVAAAPVAAAPVRPLWLELTRVAVAIVLSVGMAGGCLWLYTRGNDFPALYYHPDEWGKADQILGTSEWNFRHPLLMLESANLAADWSQAARDRQSVEIAGRWAVASLAAIGVAVISFAGFVGYGFIGLLLTGAIVGLCPALLINAHFMKEDTALFCGIMVAMLGARLVFSARFALAQVLAALVLGAGVGMAASGKYIGAITLAPALITLVMARIYGWQSMPVRIATMLAAALAVAVFINQRAFVDWTALRVSDRALNGFNYEREHAIEGHYGLGLRIPNSYWFRIATSEVMPLVWLFFAAGLGWAVYRMKFSRWGVTLVLFPLTFGILLSFNKIPMARYALPVTIGLYLIAAQLLARMLRDWYRVRRLPAAVATAVCFLAAVGFQGWRCWGIDQMFIHDSRHDLREFAARNVPANGVIAVDNHSGLHSTGDPRRHPDQTPLRQRLNRSSMHAADMADTVDAMAAAGIKYVAVSNMNFERFFDPEVGGVAGNEQWFEQHRKFYEDLFSRGKLMWQSHPRYETHGWVDMDLRLYDISNLKPPTTRP